MGDKDFGKLGPWLPAYTRGFSDNQVKGIRLMSEEMLSAQTGIHVLSAPPGIGKSSLIKGMITYCMTAVPVIPLLIITDRRARLEDYVDMEELKRKAEGKSFCREYGHRACKIGKELVNLSEENRQNRKVDMFAVRNASVVMITLQKFNLLDSKTRQELLKYATADTNSPDDENDEPNSSKGIDRIVVIDEAIVPCEVVEITPRLLSDIGSALEYRVPEGREKKTALRILKRFTGWLNGYVSDLSSQSGYKPFPVFFRYADKVPEYQGICSEAFWDVINHHRDELTKDSKDITKNLQILRSFIREDTFNVYCPGNRDEGKFRYFYSVISYMPNLKISNPVFILDGTADIDTRYL